MVRSANRELTWRDVKLILAGTTQKNDPDHPEWETGARKYYNPEQNYGYSPLYGFGVVDAAAAVEAAQSWSNLPDMITKSRSNGGWMRIKDAPVVGELKTHKSNIRISTDMDFIEFVEVHVDFDHDEARDLRITLESPSGATSTLLTPYVSISNTEFRETFRFGSARHLGENPNGVWTLRVTDEVPGQSGLIKGWKLVVRGHRTPAVWESELTAGQTTDILPAASGYSIFGNLGGTLSPDVFVIDGTTYKVLVLAHGSESLFLGLDEELPVDFTLRVGESTYVGSESMAPPATKVTALYWWPSPPPDWFAGDPAQVSLTIHPGVPLGDRQKAPVTGYFRNFPSEHDGNEDVSFRIYFSEGVATTADALHDHVLAVSGGAVSGVKAVGDEGRIWAVSVKPDSMDAVTVEIEAGLDCEVAGAVCAADGRRLFNYMKLIVAGGQLTVDEPMPESENSPATGAPVISGTAQEGETLTADTSGLADADGLDNAVFSYQWISNDGTTGADIQDATDSTYTLAADDAGKTIKVWVSFTDDVGNEESLTSAPTEAVAVLVWAATLTAGSSGTYSGYNLRQSAGSLSPNEFSLGAIEYSVKLVLEDDEGKLSFGLDQALLTVFTLHVGALRFASENASPVEGDHAYTYQWDKRTVDWSVGEEVELSLTLPETPLMAVFEDSPEGHDGENAFTFELRFSEEPDPGFSYQTLRDHAFTVSGGAVTNARRLDRPSNIRWEITVRPDSDADVIVVLPVSEDCNAQGAVCTEDGRMLSNRVELTVTGPPGSVQNTPATGLPTIGGAAQVGERLTAETSGIDDADGMDNPTFGYQWIANDGNGDGDIQGATEATYTLTGSDVGKTIKVQVSFSDGRDNEETLTSEPTEAVEPMPTPLTASIHGAPEGHDGENAFTFELRFSEEFDLGYVTLRDHAFTVSGGEVTEARRLDRPSNIRWEIVVRPDSDADVIVVLPVTENCETPGAVCTEDGGRLSNRVELTVTGPPGSVQNTPATGEPAISGAAQVGERLTAETSGIDDADGMRDATFSYQWIANDGTSDSDIEGATESTYTLTDSDVGKTIKVQVSFSDGRDNEETLTSEPTEAVEPAPNSPATGEPTISGAVQVGETLTADTSGISDADAMDNATFSYQWIANDGNGDGDIEGETASTYTLVSEDEGKTVKVRVSFSDDDGNEETLTSGATAAISPVPIGEEETEEDGPIWSATMTAGLLQDGYGYSSFAGGAGELSETEFELDGVTYTIKAVVAWGWMYIGVDKELPMDFRLEVDGKQLDSRDASLTSYSYASVYQWGGAAGMG